MSAPPDYKYILEDDALRGVRILTLNRPEKLNSWNGAMRDELRDAIERTASDTSVRTLILTGAGRAFSAGEDVSDMPALSAIGTRGFRNIARGIHDVFDLVETMEIPVIASIDGVAAGGGFELALSCDFRVMTESSRLVMPEAKVGLIPGSGGCSRLVRHVGLGRAKEVVMLGAAIGAHDARAMGLVTRIAGEGEALTVAKELSVELSSRAPLALGLVKGVLNTCTDVDMETGRRLERLAQSVLKQSDDHAEGARAFMEKRAPEWKGV